MTTTEWNTIYAASTNEDDIITAIVALSSAKMNGASPAKVAWLDYLNCNSSTPWVCTGFQSDW